MARPPRLSGNLPAEATSFVGRRHELADVRRKLTEARLVSLVGPGGVGKTRLAIRMAADLGRGFPDGAWLVELAEVRDPARVGDAVLTTLDLRDQAATKPLARLLSYLRDKKLLLVMDNCEHLVEAVALFVERAAAGSGAFELTAANQAAVVDLCRRLDGLPLAIELAAVRTRVLTAGQILDRLTDRFGLLVGGGRAALPRHQTLRTTIDWSHDLLAAGEQTLLRRLCVFAGRFTLEDIEYVCDSADALDLLSSLVDKSLVMKEDAGDLACYRLHETMREYAVLKLRAAGEEEAVERRFTDYYRTRCLRSTAEARFRLVEWLEWMNLEIDNVRSVLRRSLDQEDFSGGIALAVSLGWYWMTRATNEGVRWLDELIASGGGDAQGHFMRGFLAVLQSDPVTAGSALEKAVAAAREPSLLSQSLSLASMAANMAGDRESAKRLLGEARAACDDLPATLMSLQAQSLNGLFDGDLDSVRSASSQGVRISREIGDLYSLDMMLFNHGSVMLMAGDLGESKPLFTEALRIAQRIDDRVAQYCLLDALGCHAAGSGEARLAARLLGAAETVRTGAGAGILPFLVPLVTRAEQSAAAELGPSRFEAEFEAGKRLSRAAAIGLALGESPQVAASADVTPLGKREAEVARLVADGLSNKQIGARLFISEHTVDSHVRHILNKLGFKSRTQIAAWMASSDR